MHPRPVGIGDAVAHFVDEYLLPGLARWRLGPIADPVSAHNQYAGVGTFLQQLRQGPHEGVIAPVRLQISVHKGDNLIRTGHGAAVGQVQPRIRVWYHLLGVNPVMDDRDLLAPVRREGISLKGGRAEGGIGQIAVHQIVEVFHPQAERILDRITGREFGVEIAIRELGPVIIFAIKPDAGFRPDVAQEHRLTPAMVGQDHIGAEPDLIAQRHGRIVTGFTAQDLGFEISQPGMDVLGTATLGRIRVQRDALPGGLFLDPWGQAHNLMTQTHQNGAQMPELAGEILVDDEEFHGTVSTGLGQRQTAYSSMRDFRTASISGEAM